MNKFVIPDLRFEQSFLNTLNGYAEQNQVESTAKGELGEDIGKQPVITPGIVVYSIIKDQMIMPLIQGFLWTGFLISISPVLKMIVRQGQVMGVKVYNMLGLGKIPTRRMPQM
jgi:hypothetical protein